MPEEQTPNQEKFSNRTFLMRKILERTRYTPKILTDEELVTLKQPMKKKQFLGLGFVFSGIVLLVTALSIFLTGFQVQGFSFTILYQDEPKVVNISFVFSILLSYIGLWLISRYHVNKNRLRENTTYIPHFSKRREPLMRKTVQPDGSHELDLIKIRSFASSRLLAAVLLFVMITYNAIKFGVDLTGENQLGNWFVLGGPTLFYPTSFVAVFIAAGLLAYTLLSASVITFSKTPHFYQIEEYRFLAPWMTEIPREDVKAIRFTNAHTGAKFLWVPVFGFHITLLYVDGIHLLVNPLNYGNAFLAAGTYIGSATIQLIVLLLLLLKTHTLLEIVTDEKLYELQFSPPSMMPIVRSAIEELFGVPALTAHSKPYQLAHIDPNPEDNSLSSMKSYFIKDWFQVLFGLGLILLGIISQVHTFYAGQWMRIVFYFFGFIFLLRGIKNDFSSPRSKIGIFHHQAKNELYLRREWAWWNESFRFNRIRKEEIALKIGIKKLDFYDFLAALGFPVVLGLDIGATLEYFVPGTPSQYFPLLHILFGGIILFALIYFLILPRPALFIDSGSIHYHYALPGILSHQLFKNGKSPFGRWLELWSTVLKTNSKVCILRLIVPICVCIITCLIFIIKL
jgi:hypothetical protein